MPKNMYLFKALSRINTLFTPWTNTITIITTRHTINMNPFFFFIKCKYYHRYIILLFFFSLQRYELTKRIQNKSEKFISRYKNKDGNPPVVP